MSRLVGRRKRGELSPARRPPVVAHNFRRAVAQVKADWRRRRRIYRPWVPNPGEHRVNRLRPGGKVGDVLHSAGLE